VIDKNRELLMPLLAGDLGCCAVTKGERVGPAMDHAGNDVIKA
jgi:hypothetical protein